MKDSFCLTTFRFSLIKALLITSTVCLMACTRTILIDTVPLESAGNPLKGEGSNITHSTVLDISSADPIYSKKIELEEKDSHSHDHHNNHLKEQNKDPLDSSSILYACPMHSDVTSKNNKDLCPKCNMLINKVVNVVKPKLEDHSSHKHMHHGGAK